MGNIVFFWSQDNTMIFEHTVSLNPAVSQRSDGTGLATKSKLLSRYEQILKTSYFYFRYLFSNLLNMILVSSFLENARSFQTGPWNGHDHHNRKSVLDCLVWIELATYTIPLPYVYGVPSTLVSCCLSLMSKFSLSKLWVEKERETRRRCVSCNNSTATLNAVAPSRCSPQLLRHSIRAPSTLPFLSSPPLPPPILPRPSPSPPPPSLSLSLPPPHLQASYKRRTPPPSSSIYRLMITALSAELCSAGPRTRACIQRSDRR